MLALTKIVRCQRLITQNQVHSSQVPKHSLSIFFFHNDPNPRYDNSLRSCHNEAIQVLWVKPETGWTKLNFDGSCKGRRGKASIGGVFRNHKAEFLLGYAECIGRNRSSTIAEVTALQRGLELVLENGWSKLWIEGDAKTLVEIIVERRKVRCEEVEKHLRMINLMIPEVDRCIISHVYREGNRAADKFAKLGHHLVKPQIWRHVPPNQVLNIVHEEARGKIFLRKK